MPEKHGPDVYFDFSGKSGSVSSFVVLFFIYKLFHPKLSEFFRNLDRVDLVERWASIPVLLVWILLLGSHCYVRRGTQSFHTPALGKIFFRIFLALGKIFLTLGKIFCHTRALGKIFFRIFLALDKIFFRIFLALGKIFFRIFLALGKIFLALGKIFCHTRALGKIWEVSSKASLVKLVSLRIMKYNRDWDYFLCFWIIISDSMILFELYWKCVRRLNYGNGV